MALTHVRRALDLQPEDPETWNLLGICLSQLRDRTGAEEAYRRALLLDPGHALAINNLAALSVDRGNLTTAAQGLQDALRTNPDEATARQNVGALLGRIMLRLSLGGAVLGGLQILLAASGVSWAVRIGVHLVLAGMLGVLVRPLSRLGPGIGPVIVSVWRTAPGWRRAFLVATTLWCLYQLIAGLLPNDAAIVAIGGPLAVAGRLSPFFLIGWAFVHVRTR